MYQTNSCDIFVKMALDLRAALTCKLCLSSNKVCGLCCQTRITRRKGKENDYERKDFPSQLPAHCYLGCSCRRPAGRLRQQRSFWQHRCQHCCRYLYRRHLQRHCYRYQHHNACHCDHDLQCRYHYRCADRCGKRDQGLRCRHRRRDGEEDLGCTVQRGGWPLRRYHHLRRHQKGCRELHQSGQGRGRCPHRGQQS